MTYSFVFPQGRACFSFSGKLPRFRSLNGPDVLLLCGGRSPSEEWLQRIALEKTIYCADSGADICKTIDLLPDFFVGDGDSVHSETLEWLRENRVPCTFLPREKDETDFQVALSLLASLKGPMRSLIVSGIWGGRFDHLYSALFTSVGFLIRKKLPLFTFGDSREMLFFLCSEESLKLEFSGSLPGVFSLFPLTEECRGVTSRGTKWDLESVTLRQRYPYAISNEILLEGEECAARVEQGILGVYAWWG